MKNLLSRIFNSVKGDPKMPAETASETGKGSEIGRRTTPEDQIKYMYRLMWVDPDLRQAILDIRNIDRLDGRVKRIHNRMARDIIKGGLVMQQGEASDMIASEWAEFSRRLQLDNLQKLKSDARGLVMEGNLAMQWVLDEQNRVIAGVRMPAETIIPNVNDAGRLKDLKRAYIQFDITTGSEQAAFPLWQLTHARFDPDNFDDLGSMGRPFMDASRTTWRKLNMTEEDVVIRRRMRAPLRMAHVLKGAAKSEVDEYRAQVEKDQAHGNVTDYYMNREGSVSAVQGDSNLDQMADIVHLLDTFFSGSPLPKGMAGYTDGLARDILEDLKRDYYDEIDVAQDIQAAVYREGFFLHLLLKGINPYAEDIKITFKQRRTETMSQTMDIGLKMQALGYPRGMVYEYIGDDPAYVERRRKYEQSQYDPYEEEEEDDPPADPTVKITPGNGRKGESATSIKNGR